MQISLLTASLWVAGYTVYLNGGTEATVTSYRHAEYHLKGTPNHTAILKVSNKLVISKITPYI